MKIQTVLLLLFIAQVAVAQPRKFQLIDQEKRPVAFMDITVNDQYTDMCTDEKGWFSIDLATYAASDKVGMLTSFFDAYIATIDALRKQKKNVIRVANKTVTLDPVVVRAEVRDPVKLAELLAGIFAKRYGLHDYFLNSRCIKTVQSHGKYREFSAAMGVAFFMKHAWDLVKFPWDDPARYFLCFYDRMQSDLFQSSSNDTLVIKELFNVENFNATLNSNFMNMDPLPTLRAVELYSPMNVKAISFFEYALDTAYVRDDDQIVVLGFKSNPVLFPQKSRLLGEGRIVFNSSKNEVEQIELVNFKQYYNTFVRIQNDRPSRHKMYFRLSFTNKDENMYIREMYYSRIWNKEPLPGQDNKFSYYSSSYPARRNPVKHGLEEVFYMACDDGIGLFSDKKRVSESMFHINVVNWLYEIPYTPEFWTSCKALEAFPMEKIETDLYETEPLVSQFVRHSCESYPVDLYQKNINNPSYPGFSKQFPTYNSLVEQCKDNLRFVRQTLLPALGIYLLE